MEEHTSWDELLEETRESVMKISDCCKKAQPYTEEAYQAVREADDVFQEIVRLTDIVKSLDRSVSTLDTACAGLSAIPFVGSIAQQVSRFLMSAKDTLKVMDSALSRMKGEANEVEKTLHSILDKLETLNQTVSQAAESFPEYADSIGILSDVLQLFSSIDSLCQNEKLSSKLDSICGQITSNIEGIGNAISSIVRTLASLKEELSEIREKIENTFHGFLSVVDTVGRVLSGISSVVKPIADAFEKILDAIAPLRWVLKAVSCIINKILKPIIDAILDACGINKLLKELEEAIAKALGLDKVSEAFHELSETVTGKLSEICAGIPDLDRQIQDTLSAVKNAASSDNCDAIIREFLSDAWYLLTHQGDGQAALPSETRLFLAGKKKRLDFQPYVPLMLRYPSQRGGAVSRRILEPVEYPAGFADVDSSLQECLKAAKEQLDVFTENANGILAEFGSLEDFYTHADTHQTAVRLYVRILEAIQDVVGLWKDSAYLPSLDLLFQRIGQFLDSQKNSAEKIRSSLDGSWGLLEDLKGQLDGLVLPLQSDLDKMYWYLYRTVNSLNPVRDTVLLGYEVAKQRSDEEACKKQIDAESGKVDGRVQDVEAMLKDFAALAATQNKYISGLSPALQDLEKEIDAFETYENKVFGGELFSNASRIQNKCDTLHSMVLPLKHILAFIRDKEEEHIEAVDDYLKQVADFIDALLSEEEFTRMLDEFLNSMLPATKIQENIQKVNGKMGQVSSYIRQFDMNGNYAHMLEKSEALQGDVVYHIPDTENQEPVKNLYVDDAFINVAIHVASGIEDLPRRD